MFADFWMTEYNSRGYHSVSVLNKFTVRFEKLSTDISYFILSITLKKIL
jgi:hypothetical protein